MRSLEQIRQELLASASDIIDVDERTEQAQRDAALSGQQVERKPLNPEPGTGDYITG